MASPRDAEEDISQVLEVADQEDRVQAEEMVEDQDSMELWLVLLEDLKEPLLRGLFWRRVMMRHSMSVFHFDYSMFI